MFLLPPVHGAQTTVICASEHPLQGGKYYIRCGTEASSDASSDGNTSRLLWERSEAWVKTLLKPGGDEYEQI